MRNLRHQNHRAVVNDCLWVGLQSSGVIVLLVMGWVIWVLAFAM